ncbi:uncharacterized protein N7506_001943 [Penicillium brevicompactum]|uniref:uncharacterized protein n=1 Tax=Penicillium brevicompactum TaxID=5074 RepID=UPI002540EA4E|nr:uncharacterized protein N7506_001943 [Penicillium brevicompactum]KAJ5348690.1 hypothetical protein N7506_001943 [Penicillium brevicompactum]
MRFGRDLHGCIVPEWTAFYVPYNVVKRTLKVAVGKSVDESSQERNANIVLEVFELLGKGNESFDDFHRENCDLLRARQAELCIKYERAIKACAFSSDGTREFREARSFVKAATELREDFAKLQKYSRVNEDAIHRLYVKVERLNDYVTPAYEEQKSRWNMSQIDRHRHSVNFLNRLDSLMDSIKEAREVPEEMQLTSDKDTSQQKQFMAVKRPALYRAVSNDDPSTLAYLLRNLSRDPTLKLDRKSIVYEMAETAVSCDSKLCFENLLSKVFDRDGVVLDHDLLNQVISAEGQSDENDTESKSHSLFEFAFEHIVPRQTDALFAKDDCVRSSLHYGAMYGLNSVCNSILNCAQGLGGGYAANLILSSDSHGFTPFHYAVIKNHVEVANTFLDVLRLDNRSDETLCWELDDLLIIALRYQHDDMVYLLAYSNFGPNSKSLHNETALYVASQIGREDYVKLLLENGSEVDVNTPETPHAWTPLFIACVEGHILVVEILLEFGAKQDLVDHLGWTAKEHAALRGHLEVAEMLESWDPSDPSNMVGGPASLLQKPEPEPSTPVSPSSLCANQVIINLGILRNGEYVEAIDFEGPLATTSSSLDMSISIEDNTSELIKLPVLSDMVNEPVVLPVAKPDQARLIFKFYSSHHSYEERKLVGTGAALLGKDQKCFGDNRESLVRERTVPIFDKTTMDIMGTVTFTCVIAKSVTSFTIPQLPKQLLEKDGLQIVGHRGMSRENPFTTLCHLVDIYSHVTGLGQNTANRNQLQLGENTIEVSLLPNAQLTRDLVPIIYHDFSLSESGTDIPIHDLTFEQFMYASKLQSPRGKPASVLGRPPLSSAQRPRDRLRSRSVSRDRGESQHVHDRMKFTVDFQNKGFKPNTRRQSIQDSFTTLEELITKLPDSISFNIEIKYPRLHEAVEAGVAPVALEINTFIDHILERVFQAKSERNIILSSFSPEVCVLLTTKQNVYPVMFITNAGKLPASDLDMRASSLQAAVRFAKRWSLAGIVFASETLILCPRLVGYVKRSGLVCGSYGALNNIPENSKIQKAAGIQLLMVDNVRLITMALDEKLQLDI